MYTMILGNFQKKALGIALLILTFSILVMVYADYKTSKVTFPPTVNKCPDYFDYSGTVCRDTNNMYSKPTALTLDVGTATYSTNANADCNKKNWAKSAGVTWDGITNNNSLNC